MTPSEVQAWAGAIMSMGFAALLVFAVAVLVGMFIKDVLNNYRKERARERFLRAIRGVKR